MMLSQNMTKFRRRQAMAGIYANAYVKAILSGNGWDANRSLRGIQGVTSPRQFPGNAFLTSGAYVSIPIGNVGMQQKRVARNITVDNPAPASRLENISPWQLESNFLLRLMYDNMLPW
jgi:hypothetical protein